MDENKNGVVDFSEYVKQKLLESTTNEKSTKPDGGLVEANKRLQEICLKALDQISYVDYARESDDVKRTCRETIGQLLLSWITLHPAVWRIVEIEIKKLGRPLKQSESVALVKGLLDAAGEGFGWLNP